MPITFTKVKLPYGWLSNMSPHPITYAASDGLVKTWPTAEALFQALRFTDTMVQDNIRLQKSPMAAKMVAKRHAAAMVVVPRSSADLDNMRMILALKLEQHPGLVPELLATGNEIIIEDVSNRPAAGSHRYWGMALVAGEWVGENVLGELWMEIRDQLRGLGVKPAKPTQPHESES